MKKIIICSLAFFAYISFAFAQSDTLVINLKNNTVEKIAISQVQKITFENLADVTEIIPANTNLTVNGNYPNPFIEQTSIEFELSVPGEVNVNIYSISGNLIQTLKCSDCQSGKNYLQWNCLDINKKRVQNGIYYYEVRYKNELQSRKMIVVR